jgi:hypothetical protein
MAEVIFFLIVPRTRPASEFHRTRSPIFNFFIIGMGSWDGLVASGAEANHREKPA